MPPCQPTWRLTARLWPAARREGREACIRPTPAARQPPTGRRLGARAARHASALGDRAHPPIRPQPIRRGRVAGLAEVRSRQRCGARPPAALPLDIPLPCRQPQTLRPMWARPCADLPPMPGRLGPRHHCHVPPASRSRAGPAATWRRLPRSAAAVPGRHVEGPPTTRLPFSRRAPRLPLSGLAAFLPPPPRSAIRTSAHPVCRTCPAPAPRPACDAFGVPACRPARPCGSGAQGRLELHTMAAFWP